MLFSCITAHDTEVSLERWSIGGKSESFLFCMCNVWFCPFSRIHRHYLIITPSMWLTYCLCVSLQRTECLFSLEAFSSEQKRRVVQCLRDNIDQQLALRDRIGPDQVLNQTQTHSLAKTPTWVSLLTTACLHFLSSNGVLSLRRSRALCTGLAYAKWPWISILSLAFSIMSAWNICFCNVKYSVWNGIFNKKKEDGTSFYPLGTDWFEKSLWLQGRN